MTARSFLRSISRAAALGCATAVVVLAVPRATAQVQTQAINAPEAAPSSLPPERKIIFNPADLENEKDWKRQYFDVVVVINKAANAQTIDVYRFGKKVKSAKVSTGREKIEHADPNNSKAPNRTYLSRTWTGYFAAQKLSIDHVSNTWTDAYMPWAVFFNGGIATHRSPHEDLAAGVIDQDIGRRASGGCVRLHEQDAKDLFWMVRASGGPFTPGEMHNRRFARESNLSVKAGLAPYREMQIVPDVDPMGGIKRDSVTGEILTHYGVRTLYIVHNTPLRTSPAAGIMNR